MVLPLRPHRGGYQRAFKAAQFIQELLLNKQPYNLPKVDFGLGASPTDLHRNYQEALRRSYAENAVAIEEEERIKEGLPPLTIEEADFRTAYYLNRLPERIGMTSSSFYKYLGQLKRLGYIEFSGHVEPSQIQKYFPSAPPRRFIRLTALGRIANLEDLADPIMTLYNYPREKRSPRRKRYLT